ncbi:MAG: hypothetical protein AAB874_04880 [Patescibacteria group bacterium]
MQKKKKRSFHALDAWPPPRKKGGEEEKRNPNLPRNVSYKDPWALDEPLEGPVYDIVDPKEQELEKRELEEEKDDEERPHEK